MIRSPSLYVDVLLVYSEERVRLMRVRKAVALLMMVGLIAYSVLPVCAVWQGEKQARISMRESLLEPAVAVANGGSIYRCRGPDCYGGAGIRAKSIPYLGVNVGYRIRDGDVLGLSI